MSKFMEINAIRERAIDRFANPMINGAENLNPVEKETHVSNVNYLTGFVIGLANKLMKEEDSLIQEGSFDSYFEKLVTADQKIYRIMDDSVRAVLQHPGRTNEA